MDACATFAPTPSLNRSQAQALHPALVDKLDQQAVDDAPALFLSLFSGLVFHQKHKAFCASTQVPPICFATSATTPRQFRESVSHGHNPSILDGSPPSKKIQARMEPGPIVPTQWRARPAKRNEFSMFFEVYCPTPCNRLRDAATSQVRTARWRKPIRELLAGASRRGSCNSNLCATLSQYRMKAICCSGPGHCIAT